VVRSGMREVSGKIIQSNCCNYTARKKRVEGNSHNRESKLLRVYSRAWLRAEYLGRQVKGGARCRIEETEEFGGGWGKRKRQESDVQ